MPRIEVGTEKSRRFLGALGIWLFMGFGFILSGEWIWVEAEPTIRREPSGAWGVDKQGRATLNDVLFTGEQTQWYSNGQKVLITYRDGQLDAVLTLHSNGQKGSEVIYRDGKIIDGMYVTWYENGQKSSENIYRDGKNVDGISVSWHPNGQKASEYTYRDGVFNGTSVKWHPNGQKAEESTYRDGKSIDGSFIRWDEDGLITFKGTPTALTLGAQLKASLQGVTVAAIAPQSPASRASLQVGDRLLTLEGQPVPKIVAAFLAQLATYAEGSYIKLEIERAGTRHTLRLPWMRQDPSAGSGQAPIKALAKPVGQKEKSQETPGKNFDGELRP